MAAVTKKELTRRGIELFGDKEVFKKWLSAPNIALGNVKPRDLMVSSSGRSKIESALEALHYGNML